MKCSALVNTVQRSSKIYESRCVYEKTPIFRCVLHCGRADICGFWDSIHSERGVANTCTYCNSNCCDLVFLANLGDPDTVFSALGIDWWGD